MVDIQTLEKMKEHYNDNIERYVKEHHGEYVLLEGFDVKESFYETKKELNKKINEYKDSIGPTFYYEKIPKKLFKRKPKIAIDLEKLKFKDISELTD